MSVIGRAAAKIVVGRALAVAIVFAAAPLLTRLYSPEEFGLAELVVSVSTWVGAFACLGYAVGIPLTEERSETRALVALCLLLTGALIVPVVLLTLGGAGALAHLVDEPALRQLLWFLPAMFLALSLTRIGQYACSREGRFGLLSASYFAQDGLKPVLQVVLAVAFGAGAGRLLWGTLAAMACGAAVAGAGVVGVLAAGPRGEAAPMSLADAARRHAQFPKVHMWSTVLNVASRMLPVVLMGAVFSSTVVGYYSLGYKVLGLPLMVLGVGVARAFYPQAAEEWRETASVTDSAGRSVLMLSTTCVFPLVAVAMLGQFLFEFVFGAPWREAGLYAQLLAPWMFVTMVASPLSATFLIVRRAGVSLAYNVALLVARPTALVVGGHLGGERVGILCLSAVGLAVQCCVVLTAKRLGRARCSIGAVVLRDTLYALGLLLPAAAAWWGLESAPACLALLAAATCVHGLVVYRRSPLLRAALGGFASRLRPADTEEGQTEGEDDAEL